MTSITTDDPNTHAAMEIVFEALTILRQGVDILWRAGNDTLSGDAITPRGKWKRHLLGGDEMIFYLAGQIE